MTRAALIAEALAAAGFEARVDGNRVRFYAPNATRPSLVKTLPSGGLEVENVGLRAMRVIGTALTQEAE